MKKVHKTAVISTLEDSAELCNYILHQELEEEDLLEFVKDMERINKIEKEQIYEIASKVLNRSYNSHFKKIDKVIKFEYNNKNRSWKKK